MTLELTSWLSPLLANGDGAGNTAWMLTSSALVLLMVPGLALFYGGMVRQKNVLTTMMHSFVAMAVIGVQWILVGYAIAFGADHFGLIGWSSKYLGLVGISPTTEYHHAIPELVFVMFQGKFAIITPALISGAVAERIKFSSYVLFIILWSTLIYDPLAHWVWAEGGWLFKLGVLDFAGGTVVHVSAGVSAVALILLLGRRRDYPDGAILPNNLVLTLTGAGLLWFGWFGFNAGSAVAVTGEPIAGPTAGLAFTTTQTAAAAAALVWILLEWLHRKKPTSLGIASGIVAGLVAVTPAAGYVIPVWAMVIGAVASVLCYGAVQMKAKLKYDDSLDAFGVHGVGGAWGALATGIFCSVGATGLIGGSGAQFLRQLLGVSVAAGFAFAGTLVIGLAIKLTIGLRATEQQERDGLDITIHGEHGYHLEGV
ncbi:MAG: ammonium transporter [Phycisphaerae bacterium]|nr:ammonium transporter [Phycisphaerae bacterium]